MNYEVIVGNIGMVYCGPSKRAADGIFRVYQTQSQENYGRAAGEDVIMLKGGEIILEYEGNFGGPGRDE